MSGGGSGFDHTDSAPRRRMDSSSVPPAVARPPGLADPNDYRISAPAEVASLLGALCAGGVPLQLAAPDGPAVDGLRLAAVDASRRLLAFGGGDQRLSDDARLPPLLAAARVVAAAALDGIALQFEVDGLLRVQGAGGCTLRCAWPPALWRFQRRGGYRLRSSLPVNPPHAVLRHPALADAPLSLRVLDLSAGGCALLLPDEPGSGGGSSGTVEPGLRIGGVQLRLDAGTRLDVGLLLRHVGGNGRGARGLRLGFEWAPAPGGGGERVLQRWIDQAQRRPSLGAAAVRPTCS